MSDSDPPTRRLMRAKGATSRAGFALPCRKTTVCPEEAAYFLVAAGSTWDSAVDARTLLWMKKICRHRGLDGSDSFLSSDRGGSRNRQRCRYVRQRYPKSQTKVQKATRACELISSEVSAEPKYPGKARRVKRLSSETPIVCTRVDSWARVTIFFAAVPFHTRSGANRSPLGVDNLIGTSEKEGKSIYPHELP